ncbi:unnamed protein product [Acanthoscelides obtectus]|uniref:Uncharacterized protein n=1 Tax=Acanthoscelides obtectus TaxID=200917 RepID=A0A9P0Q0V5_ACAOB|nr:unnamed protein product [Acanthoscelides obtectus]CAK1675390.1 hypothetical protein AOBTE_LOCUS30191 [Acanthoscelides obtectus]
MFVSLTITRCSACVSVLFVFDTVGTSVTSVSLSRFTSFSLLYFTAFANDLVPFFLFVINKSSFASDLIPFLSICYQQILYVNCIILHFYHIFHLNSHFIFFVAFFVFLFSFLISFGIPSLM